MTLYYPFMKPFPQLDRPHMRKSSRHASSTKLPYAVLHLLDVFPSFFSLSHPDSTPSGCGCPSSSLSSTSTSRIRPRCRMVLCATCWPTKWTNLMHFLRRRRLRSRRMMCSGLRCLTAGWELLEASSMMTRTCWTWAKSSCAKRYVNGFWWGRR